MNRSVYEIFEHFRQATVLVIGDVMLDTYYIGSSDRVSPEAPVPVVNVKQKESRPGGAANVAMNLKGLGANVFLSSVIGSDQEGRRLLRLMKENELSEKYILTSETRPTTEKSRVISKNQQMLRFDVETEEDINPSEEAAFLEMIKKALAENEIDAVIFQDYNKGVLTEKVIKEILGYCAEHNLPTSVDPKKKNFFSYHGCTLFKPNLKEINEALNASIDKQHLEQLQSASQKMRNKLNHHITMITLSEKGMFVSNHSSSEIVPATIRNVADVSGAGDTVISVATLCLIQGTDLSTMAMLANIAGGLACESVGVLPIDREAFLEEASGTFQKII